MRQRIEVVGGDKYLLRDVNEANETRKDKHDHHFVNSHITSNI